MSQQPCLPVGRRRKRQEQEGEDVNDFDNVASMDASEYLRMVVSQASQLPDIFSAQLSTNDNTTTPKKKPAEQAKPAVLATGSFAAAQYMVSQSTELLPPPDSSYVPKAGKEWADRTLDAFSRLRLYLEQMKELGIGDDKLVELPPLKDRAAWHILCVGKDDAEGNVGSYFGDDDDDDDEENVNDDDDNDNDDPPAEQREEETMDGEKNKDANSKDDDAMEEDYDVAAWKQGLLQTPEGHYWPTTSLVLQMDQVMVRRVLSHLTYFVCEGWSLTPARAAWLYALLARLDRSVHRDDAVILYRLLKCLTVARSQYQATDASPTTATNTVENELSRINILILILGTYFEQGGGYAATMQVQS